jgi:hypothetical protein
MTTVHDLKVVPPYFEPLEDGRKTFEIRRDDRGGYEVGDVLRLREWQPMAGTGPLEERGGYSGREITRTVTYVLAGPEARVFGVQAGYAILGLGEEPTRPCPRCEGCGQIANSDDGEPWTVWEELPPGSDLAVRVGLVRPITCPGCRGTRVVPA